MDWALKANNLSIDPFPLDASGPSPPPPPPKWIPCWSVKNKNNKKWITTLQTKKTKKSYFFFPAPVPHMHRAPMLHVLCVNSRSSARGRECLRECKSILLPPTTVLETVFTSGPCFAHCCQAINSLLLCAPSAAPKIRPLPTT